MTEGDTRPATSIATFDVIPVDELFDNHDEFSIPPTDALAGRTLAVELEDGTVLECVFGESRVRWSASRELPWGSFGEDEFEAVEVREGIFSVTIARLEANASLLCVVDLAAGRVATVASAFVETPEGVRERTEVVRGSIDGATAAPMPRTEELVGLRVHYRYSTTHAFEHIYVDADHYVWHGIEGPERGMGGFEPAEAYKVGEELYLFTWHERASPFTGAIVIDLREGRSIGRLFGWHLEKLEAMQVPTGTTATLLNRTSYEGL